jgi:hypothetical protein
MDWNVNQTAIIAASIGATAGLIGVVIGSLLTWIREAWSARRIRTDHARYLAIRVVCVLDGYVGKCAEVVDDDGLSYGQRNEKGYLVPQVETPDAPKFPEDLDWKSVEHILAYKLLSMSNEAEMADSKISSVSEYVASPPDFEEYFEERQDQYSKLGLAAFAITQTLREKYKLPSQEFADWNPAERLRKARQEVEEVRQERYQRIAASLPPPPP